MLDARGEPREGMLPRDVSGERRVEIDQVSQALRSMVMASGVDGKEGVWMS